MNSNSSRLSLPRNWPKNVKGRSTTIAGPTHRVLKDHVANYLCSWGDYGLSATLGDVYGEERTMQFRPQITHWNLEDVLKGCPLARRAYGTHLVGCDARRDHIFRTSKIRGWLLTVAY